jgi:subtilase family serine protease
MVWPRRKRFRPLAEGLDQRWLLSAAGLTPAQVETAYGLSGLTFGGQAANGSGQTIAIVDGYHDPNLQAELAAFDAANHLLAPPSLRVIGASGSAAPAASDSGWAQEEALDVEWTHALAPGAAIVVVEANSGTIPDLMAGVRTAAGIPGVSVVTMSWSGSEALYFNPSYDTTFATPGITFVAASGDAGAFGGVQYPASSPYVLSVGGTSLQIDSSGNYLGETPWFGTSGGISFIEPEPSYQFSVQSTGGRTVPDVAFDGNPDTGVEVYTIDVYTGQGSWMAVAGTSLGAQAWGALIAVVDQGRALAGKPILSSTETLNALYSLPASDFHAVAGGYNTQTGLGTPNGASLINALVASSASDVQSSETGNTPAPANPAVSTHKKAHHPKPHHRPGVAQHKLHPTKGKGHHAKPHPAIIGGGP